ncbi:MAG: type secretion system protein [Candidatus Eremiobacteraeota bacterium]|jgi:tight adherence protein B|nr:type secretion system protein [Candidatus Eremiobacteraeota bacterium]
MNAFMQVGIVAGITVSVALMYIALAGQVQRAAIDLRSLIERLGTLRASPTGIVRAFTDRRKNKIFMPQLESALRMIAGSLRVGLGLRQALVVVGEDLPDPAGTEFMRVVGRTNLGVSILDALDEFAERMPSSELTMTVRAIRVQSTTGGDLADLLDSIADTIKARRTLARKVQALTAEGRVSAYVILSMPIGVGIFLALTQPRLGHALLTTGLGHATIGVVIALEALASFVISRMLKVEL